MGKMKSNNGYAIIFTLLLCWIWMLFYIVNELIGGIVGVVVACLATLITCYIVKERIERRIFMHFLEASKERLHVLEELIDTSENILDEIANITEWDVKCSVRNSQIQQDLQHFYHKLVSSDLEIVYKYMEYESIVRVKNKLSSLKKLSEKESFIDVDATSAVEDINEVYFIFDTNRQSVEEILKIKIIN
ncbi:hypothetical protein P4654_08560 [Niallia taxi]|uniref:hypothetical protein n=1 Tax=Niallia taxi TaxID=2499688 RepID=UPI002E1CB436|nr:hypothetical protein [Niallia taxi]MED4118279.1 hypothetical protein [Niallia taxi]